jgi:hypothetical protein
MAKIRGGDYKALLQVEDSFKQTPATPNAKVIKFSSFEFGLDIEHINDDTIAEKVLEGKPCKADIKSGGSISAILCLNDIGLWLKLLWGTPATTDNGDGTYSHVYTLSNTEPPSALLCLENSTASKFTRWHGVMLNSISLNMGESDGKITYELIGCDQESASGAWHAAATQLDRSRSCGKSGKVYDIDGGSTLGLVDTSSITITNDMEGISLLDGEKGYGDIITGQKAISGSSSILLDTNTNMLDHALSDTVKPMTLVIKSDNGTDQMHIHMPSVYFKEPKQSINTSKGIVQQIDWQAFDNGGGTQPTITLINQIASY